jgi:hypothetical protein
MKTPRVGETESRSRGSTRGPAAAAARLTPDAREAVTSDLQAEVDRSPRMTAQRATIQRVGAEPGATRTAEGGLPEELRTEMETQSGVDLSDARVYRQSARPAEVGALAFASGGEIHLAPGQDHHLPHETWHLVQQRQGRVAPTLTLDNGARVNDDPALEHEADVMGERARAAVERTAAEGAARGRAAHDVTGSGAPGEDEPG